MSKDAVIYHRRLTVSIRIKILQPNAETLWRRLEIRFLFGDPKRSIDNKCDLA